MAQNGSKELNRLIDEYGGRLKERVKNVLNLKKSSRIAVVCAVVLVAVAGFGLMTNRTQAEKTAENNSSSYEESHTDAYLTVGATDCALSDISNQESDVPEQLRHVFALDANTVEDAAVRILITGPALPMGWHLTNIYLGGREYHLYHEFETHEIMLNPYTIAIEYVVVDTPWTHDAEMALMERADLLFDHFEELLAVSFRIQKVERADGMTNYKNAQLTREREPIHGENTWCHEDYVTHLIPFYVTVFNMFCRISVTFQWVPLGFELYEVENIVNSLRFEELGLQMDSLRVTDTWLQYGQHVYSFAIHFAQTQNIEDAADIEEIYAALKDKAKYLFDSFSDLMYLSYNFDLSDYSGAGFVVRRGDMAL